MVFKRLAQENGVFYTIYIQKEQIAATKNDHGHINLIRPWGLILCKEDSPRLCKIESALESDKWCLNGWLKNIVKIKYRKKNGKNKSTVQKTIICNGPLAIYFLAVEL
jgi:hypothetical protein